MDILTLPVAAIHCAADRPRRRFDAEGLAALARSIQQHGLLHPILVRRRSVGGYELLAGERRLRAVRDLGQAGIAAIVTAADPAELSLVENMQREGLDALELAEALQRLAERGDDRATLARLIGRSRSVVGDILLLNSLPDAIKQEYPAVRRQVSRSLLVEIARTRDPDARAALWDQAKAGTLTVREAKRARRTTVQPPALPRVLAAVRRCVKQLEGLEAAPELAEEDCRALLALRARIDGLLTAAGAWNAAAIPFQSVSSEGLSA